jgi:hypothetical protein
VHTHACNNLYNIIADPITKFQKQREPSFQIFSKKNQNQITANSYHFKTLAEPMALWKALVNNQQLFYFIFHENQGSKSENWFFPKKNKNQRKA